MLQKTQAMKTNNINNPIRFAPRKDIEIIEAPKPVQVNLSLNRIPQFNIQYIYIIIFLFFLKFILQDKGAKFKKSSIMANQFFTGVIKKPETSEILCAISPYLDEYDQNNVYTLVGFLEIYNIATEILNGTYQSKRILNTPQILGNENDARVNLLKTLKPYVPDNTRPIVDNIIKAQDISSQLAKNIRIYKSRKLSNAYTPIDMDSIYDTVQLISPIFPQEHKEKIDKVLKVVRVMQAMNLGTKFLSTSNKPTDNIDSLDNKDNINSAEGIGNIDGDKDNQLTENEKNQLGAFMKMIQMLNQPNEN